MALQVVKDTAIEYIVQKALGKVGRKEGTKESEDLQEPGVEGDEDYKLVPQYDYNDAILDGQNEDV
ncbi:hypothetical protein CKAN_00422200 [Cinnamomum micranthum f. kanehirae]|uniref:Uncharacterized protein n=1 Tax=Cinnamomum micranthum f. kanehirae TaxID=337451 RepID=A0A443NBD5_9MAGN|nr:hypothetical protein CKAN_00422200 [Cinnamomum micranthum f. kanehirae]